MAPEDIGLFNFKLIDIAAQQFNEILVFGRNADIEKAVRTAGTFAELPLDDITAGIQPGPGDRFFFGIFLQHGKELIIGEFFFEQTGFRIE